jgi:hypothetical protein
MQFWLEGSGSSALEAEGECTAIAPVFLYKDIGTLSCGAVLKDILLVAVLFNKSLLYS